MRSRIFDVAPLDLGESARRDMILNLEDMGFEIEASHHEVAPAQHEIDFAFEDALSTADKVMTFKMAVRTIAKRYGLHATFMPKPRQDVNGSGLHLHMRLLKNGRNVFTGENGELSTDGEAFLAGILGHVVGMTAVFNPLVNSYKRLVPGFEAPSDVTWSRTQRNALLHVRKRRGEGVDLELRSPDCAANPYLLLALCLEAGLDGIRKQQKAPKELTEDICRLSDEEKKQRKIQSLPENLGVALDAMGAGSVGAGSAWRILCCGISENETPRMEKLSGTGNKVGTGAVSVSGLRKSMEAADGSHRCRITKA